MSSSRIVVVGSCNMDLIWHGQSLPAPGETVSNGRFTQSLGGKGANQASAAALLGAEVAFVGCTGKDEYADAIRADLRARGINIDHLQMVSDAATGTALISVDAQGENTIAVAPGANRCLSEHQLRQALAELQPEVLIVGFEIGVEMAALALRVGKELKASESESAECRTICNPSPIDLSDQSWIADCDTVIVNQGEADAYGGAAELLALGATEVLVTKGAAGAELHRSGTVQGFPSYEVSALDSTGAGDSFCAAFAVSADPAFACAAGALATRSVGARAALPTRAEVEALLRA
jgi:ribokinase